MKKKPIGFEQKVNPSYPNQLLTLLPKRGFGVTRRIADLLAFNNVKPLRAEAYTPTIINNIIYKRYFDLNVESALIQLIEEFYGKPLEELMPDYQRRYPKRTFERPRVWI